MAKKISKPFKPSPGLKKVMAQRAADEEHLLGKSAGLTDYGIPSKAELKDAAKLGTGAADMSWEDAEAELRKDPLYKITSNSKNAVPVESDKPGVARNPKPPKVVKPVAADGSLVPLEIISYHFLKLMERLASESMGSHTKALEDLRADIAKKQIPC